MASRSLLGDDLKIASQYLPAEGAPDVSVEAELTLWDSPKTLNGTGNAPTALTVTPGVYTVRSQLAFDTNANNGNYNNIYYAITDASGGAGNVYLKAFYPEGVYPITKNVDFVVTYDYIIVVPAGVTQLYLNWEVTRNEGNESDLNFGTAGFWTVKLKKLITTIA
jgi:hypothetical protein